MNLEENLKIIQMVYPRFFNILEEKEKEAIYYFHPIFIEGKRAISKNKEELLNVYKKYNEGYQKIKKFYESVLEEVEDTKDFISIKQKIEEKMNCIIFEIPHILLYRLYEFLSYEEQDALCFFHGPFLNKLFLDNPDGKEMYKNYCSGVTELRKMNSFLVEKTKNVTNSNLKTKIVDEIIYNFMLKAREEQFSILDIPYFALKEMLPILTLKEKDALFLYYGEHFDSIKKIEFEMAAYLSKQRACRKLVSFYQAVLKSVDLSVHSTENEHILIQEIRRRLDFLIYKIPSTILGWIVESLPSKAKEIFYLVHGEHLDEFHLMTELCSSEELSKYWMNYRRAEALIKNIYQEIQEMGLTQGVQIKQFICHSVQKRRSSKKIHINDEISPQVLKELMPILSKKQEEAFYLYLGKNLDTVHPEQLKNQDKSMAAIYQAYESGCKKIKSYYQKILDFIPEDKRTEEVIIEEIRKSYHCVIYEISPIILAKLVSLLSPKLFEVFVLRHGTNYDKILCFPKPPNGKSASFYHTRYKMAVAKIRELYRDYLLEEKKMFLSEYYRNDFQEIISEEEQGNEAIFALK